ncbi:GNAT family N-acetyltransferase [Brevibacillus humidisoli]|uniref:GNAT family N-acetyltransferase n=1 Tax=Brevibacillus humidisoli TaxID=2895522 RepID=UPI001E45A66D|nr:GNAT family N-acyltransferase [Brevibacillus humidisoli]UFJ41652.1 GNAT family N-acetyltransferase [Brevibacillus humidisoli]
MPLTVKLAETEEERNRAFALRHQVFVQEKGNHPDGSQLGIQLNEREEDEYDAISEHIIVVDEETREVIGTYRLVDGGTALRTLGFYSDRFFQLHPIRSKLTDTIELGRSCIRADYRSGRAITLLWRAIGDLMIKRQIRFLIGLTSLFPSTNEELMRIYTYLIRHYRMGDVWLEAKSEYRVAGVGEVELVDSEQEMFRKLPPLLKGYLRAGACVAGEPAYDPGFGSTLFFTMLDSRQIAERYRRGFLTRTPIEREEKVTCTSGSDV